jgi:hypothetical protein
MMELSNRSEQESFPRPSVHYRAEVLCLKGFRSSMRTIPMQKVSPVDDFCYQNHEGRFDGS